MPGFYITNTSANIKLENTFNNKCVSKELTGGGFIVKRNTLNKFMDDKLFYSDDEYIIITEGVILNKINLIKKYDKKDFIETVKTMATENEDTFYNQFRGSFSGAIYYKNKDKWIIYTNHFGDKGIFYYNNTLKGKTKYILGAQANYIINALKILGTETTINTQAIYYMLTYAFMGDDSTYANEIKRLLAGQYIKIEKGVFSVNIYHVFARKDADKYKSLSENAIIEKLDNLFRAAVKLEYDKDVEYGYKHIADLSGGLDSRMNVWVAKDLGYSDMLNVTYCQSNYLDEIIAKEIAEELKNELIVKTLDEASFMCDVDIISSMNFGTALYSGITGDKRFLDCLDFNNFGLEHTGQLGDVIIGSYLRRDNELSDNNIKGTYSKKLLFKINNEHIIRYKDSELYMIYVRGINGILSTHFIRQNYTEVSSPFLNVELLEFCLSIPLSLRVNHEIYKKWIIKKYPEAAVFKWESINAKITESNKKLFIKKVVTRGPKKMLKILHIIKDSTKIKKGKSMNPLDYWYDNNKELKNYMDGYFKETLNKFNLSETILNDLKFMYNKGGVTEKTMVLSVLGALKIYF